MVLYCMCLCGVEVVRFVVEVYDNCEYSVLENVIIVGCEFMVRKCNCCLFLSLVFLFFSLFFCILLISLCESFLKIEVIFWQYCLFVCLYVMYDEFVVVCFICKEVSLLIILVNLIVLLFMVVLGGFLQKKILFIFVFFIYRVYVVNGQYMCIQYF